MTGLYVQSRDAPEERPVIMYLPLFAFGIFASILFAIGLVAGKAADRNAIREDEKRRRALDAA